MPLPTGRFTFPLWGFMCQMCVKTDSFIWPTCVRRQQTADRDPLGSVVTLHPLLGRGKHWASATPNANNPLRETTLTGRTSWAREVDTAIYPVLWRGLGNTPLGNLCNSSLHIPGSLTGRMISLTGHRKYIFSSKNPQGVHSMSLTELITFGACSYSAENLNNRTLKMHSLMMTIPM